MVLAIFGKMTFEVNGVEFPLAVGGSDLMFGYYQIAKIRFNNYDVVKS